MFCGKSKLEIAQSAFQRLRVLDKSQFARCHDCLNSEYRCEELEISNDEKEVYRCGWYGATLGPLARRARECNEDA